MLAHITPVILTYNEECNIERTMSRLAWATDIVVVDSGSTDGTLDIVKRFPQARIYHRPFDTHAEQWRFAIVGTDIRTEWLLRLDADYVVSTDLIDELSKLDARAAVDAYRIAFDFAVAGKMLRAALYPPNIILFRRGTPTVIEDGHTERWNVKGPVVELRGRVVHDDRKPMHAWFAAQRRYSRLEAEALLRKPHEALSAIEHVRLRGFALPILVFFYVLFIKGCILDGRAGLVYAWQRTIAEAMIALQVLELKMAVQSGQDE
jgi:glycosyltransferase involved in cell wall biosynthesis